MQELKRLLTGFLASLMVLSLILSPIPKANIVWADDTTTTEPDCEENADEDDNKGKIYKAGCDLDDTLTQTKLSNLSNYQEGLKGMIQQQIVGMMGMVLINSLRFRRLHKYRPEIYGNDCAMNIAGLITLPMATLGALLYIIGDVQSNIKFQEAAKKAVDEEFAVASRKAIPEADSAEVEAAKENGEEDPRISAIEHNNKQMAGYTTLLEVMYAQQSAVETKIGLARAQSIANYLAEAVELGYMIACGIKCKKAYMLNKKDLKQTISNLPKAVKAAAAGETASKNPYTAAANTTCSAVTANVVKIGIELGIIPGKNEAVNAAEEAENAKETAEQTGFFTKIFASLKNFFRPTFKAPEIPAKQEARDATEASKRAAKATELTTLLTNLEQVGIQAKSGQAGCAVAGELGAQLVQAWVRYNSRIIPCCGGPGLIEAELIPVKKAFTTHGGIAADLETSGSVVSQGVGLPGRHYKKQDLIVFGLLQKVSESNPEIFKDTDSTFANHTFWMKNSFESMLRRYALKNVYQTDTSDPRGSLSRIAKAEPVIKKLVNDFESIIAGQDHNSLASGDYQKLPAWQNLMKNVVEFIRPVTKHVISDAQAIGAGAIIGPVCSMLASQLQGPWASVMNVGCSIITLNDLLGKIAREWAFIKPLNRSITWALMAVVIEFVISWDKEARDKIVRNIEILERERERFSNSSVQRTSLERGGRDANKGSLQKYDYTNSRAMGEGVMGCAVPKGDGFAPAPCPTVVPKKAFELPKISNEIGNMMAPEFGQGSSFVTGSAYAAANGNTGSGPAFGDGDFENADNLAAALAAHNATLRDKIDKIEASRKVKPKHKLPSLASINADFKRAFGTGGSSGGPSLGSSGSSGGAYVKAADKEVINNVVAPKKKASKAGTAAASASKAKGFDLDFGDDEEESTSNADDSNAVGAAGKKQQKLDDFVLEHDDISKKKDVPIWKILSNRYILSYPKVLDEEDAKVEPDKVKKKKK